MNLRTASTPTRTKILLVDDLPENLLALSALLERDDIELLQARDGAEALELLLVHPVSLALVDVQMPEMDGFELAELMRGSERTRSVPIIFVTAGTSDDRRVFKGYETGAVDFLYKPLDPHVLRSKVDVFIELAEQKARLADELQQKTEQLRLNEMFTAMLGHDLRGPLSAIVMGSILQVRKAPDDAARVSASRMLDAANRMNRLIADMLDLARVRLAGGMPVSRKRLDLGALLVQAIDEHRLSAPERPIELALEGDLEGDWDPDRLAQTVANLVSNALQHGDPADPVRCEADGSHPDLVILSVCNGGAIPDALLPQIFDPFRGRELGQRREGLGLGLYIVEQIAVAHGGRVDVFSDDGTVTFAVTLPRTDPVAD